jgi:hypothetical protein
MPGSSIIRRWQNHQAKFGEINTDILWALDGVDSDIAWAGVDGNLNWSTSEFELEELRKRHVQRRKVGPGRRVRG